MKAPGGFGSAARAPTAAPSARIPSWSAMYRRAEARAAGDHSIFTATTEQLSHDLFVRPRTWAACSHPLLVSFQDGVGLGGVQVFRGGTTFQRPEPLVLIDRHHHGGLTAQMY